MSLDARDPLDELLRETLRQDVAAAAGSLARLENRVMESLGERVPRRGFWSGMRAMVAPTRGGRWAQLAFVGATACAFLLLGTFLGGRLPFGHQAEPMLLSEATTPAAKAVTAEASVGNGVLFILPAPNAKVVSLVGSFSEWEPVPLADDDRDGIWTAQVPLPPGRYEYAFIIDGRWFGQDPSADEYVRSFGEYSSVRYIGGGGDGA
jgi:hypothetical protein